MCKPTGVFAHLHSVRSIYQRVSTRRTEEPRSRCSLNMPDRELEERHRLIRKSLSGTQCTFLPSKTHGRQREKGTTQRRRNGWVEQLHEDLIDMRGGAEGKGIIFLQTAALSIPIGHTHTYTAVKCSVYDVYLLNFQSALRKPTSSKREWENVATSPGTARPLHQWCSLT